MRKSICILLVMMLLFITSSTVVFAGVSYGSSTNFTAGSKSYTGCSYVITNTWAYAFQRTSCKTSNASAGWLGSKARLYTSSGTLKGSSAWNYNSSTVSKGKYFLKSWGFNSSKGKSFYSYGQSRGWNTSTSSYVTKTTPRSANQTSE